MITAAQLQPFCSVDETRRKLLTPYVLGGDTYATDGHLAVHVPGALAGVETKDDAPDPRKIIGPLLKAGPWLKIPAEGGRLRPCMRCDEDHLCDACDGDAEVTGEFRHNDETYPLRGPCPVCGGDGVCPACNGTGLAPDLSRVKLGHRTYRADRLRKVGDLPGAELCDGEGYAPTYFRFDGGDGAIMPERGEA